MPSASLATNLKPTLGYSSRTAAVIALKAQGLTWPQVGDQVGLPAKQCASLACKARQRAEKTIRTVELTLNHYLDIEREARRRGMTPDELARTLLSTIAGDRLYAAVLD